MKRFCAVIAIAIAMLTLSNDSWAQKFVPAEVTISKSKVDIDGRSYYVHPVEAKQTLYSICKAYGADLEEVKEINAGKLSGGLKAGSMLLIPVVDKVEDNAAAETPATEKVTVAKSAPATGNSDNGDVKYIKHRVKWYDSLLMLSLKYKVSQEDIVAFNNLDSKTLVVGQVLKIPIGNVPLEEIDDNDMIQVEEDEQFAQTPDEGTSELTITDDVPDQEEEVEEEWAEPVFVPFSGTANIALMLPIAARSSSPSGNFLDFYAGVLMALEDVRKDGTNVSLKVIDMADYDSAEALLAEAATKHFDFVIANFNPESIEAAASWCDRRRMPLISPLDQKIEAATYNHPYLINAPISASTQAMRIVESMKYNKHRDNVVVVCENLEYQGQFHKDIVSSLDSLGIPFTYARRGSGESVRAALVSGKKNHVIITSEKESMAADAVRNIGLMARNASYDIVGYASHKTRRYESIEKESFSNMNAHFSLGYYVDYSDENVREFVRKYRALYNAEPGNFAFQGYDIAKYFVTALKKYGSDMINGIASYKAEGLQLNFRFDRRNEEGGMFNEATKDIVY